MSEAKVRVAVAEPNTEVVEAETRDYQFLLEENLELLRAQNEGSKEQLKLHEQIKKLERQLAESKKILAKRTTLKAWRRRVALFHVPFGMLIASAGVALWLKHLAPPEACFFSLLAGAVWTIGATMYLHSLASEEN